ADPADVRPFELLLINAADGGREVVTGHAPAVRELVPGCPVLRTPAELAALGEAAAAEVVERPGESLDEHSAQVRDQAAALLEVLGPAISDSAWRSVIVAGWLHDVGKGHATWQDALCALAPASDRDMVAAGRPWAKSGSGAEGRLGFAGGVTFRHELASLLLLDGPLRDLLAWRRIRTCAGTWSWRTTACCGCGYPATVSRGALAGSSSDWSTGRRRRSRRCLALARRG